MNKEMREEEIRRRKVNEGPVGWAEIQQAQLQRLAKEGVFLQVRSIPNQIGEDVAGVTVTERSPTLLQFRELDNVTFKEQLLYTNNPTHAYKKGTGTSSGSVSTKPPNTDDVNVNRDNFPTDADLPLWLRGAQPANSMVIKFESESAYKQFIANNSQSWGLQPLAMYSDMQRTGSFYVLFRKLGTTPVSALDDEPSDHTSDQEIPAGPVK